MRPQIPVIVLGAGVTGLTVAWELARTAQFSVDVIEPSDASGGLARSFTDGDRVLDIGSHRINEAYDPAIVALLRELLGDDMLRRPRRGQIRIRGRQLDYPPPITQIVTSLGLTLGFAAVRDYVAAALRRIVSPPPRTSFEEHATAAVGRTLYECFYAPYAIKLWGVSPDALSFEPAVARIRKFSARAVCRDVWRALTGSGRSFQYPARGFGQIAARIADRLTAAGGRIRFGTIATRLELNASESTVDAVHVADRNGVTERLPAAIVISTAPLAALDRLLAFDDDRDRQRELGLAWRSLRIVYLTTSEPIADRTRETFYFPDPDVLFGRVSLPARYRSDQPDSPSSQLTIEIPCTRGDGVWTMEDGELTARCLADLNHVGLLNGAPLDAYRFFSLRVPDVYPVYSTGWKGRLAAALARQRRLRNLFAIGRSALFLHCNVDHCMLMALELARFLSTGPPLDRVGWDRHAERFFSFAVHD